MCVRTPVKNSLCDYIKPESGPPHPACRKRNQTIFSINYNKLSIFTKYHKDSVIEMLSQGAYL